jgi:putative oxidoreductase
MNRTIGVLTYLSDLAARIGQTIDWLPPTVARLTVGLVFFQSGWGKLQNLAQVTDYFTELGLPAPAFQATLVSATELACGSLLLAGWATRFAAVPLMLGWGDGAELSIGTPVFASQTVPSTRPG